MRRQIRGRLYDTEKARLAARCDDGELYQKRTGEWFLHADATITPLSYSEAFRWAEGRLDEDELADLVLAGAAATKGKPRRVTVALNPDAYAILKREAAERGITLTAVIEAMAWRLDAERETRSYPWREQ